MGDSYRLRAVDDAGKPLETPKTEPLQLPARFELVPDDNDSDLFGYHLFLTLRELGQGLEIEEFTISKGEHASGVSAGTLRKVLLSSVLAACRNALGHYGPNSTFGEPWGDWSTVVVTSESDFLSRMDLDTMRRRVKGFPPLVELSNGTFGLDDPSFVDQLRKAGPSSEQVHLAVRGLYMFAVSRDLAPVGFIASVLGIPQATASHWVKLTREADYLPPAAFVARGPRKGK